MSNAVDVERDKFLVQLEEINAWVTAMLQRIADDAENRRAELHEELLDVRGVSTRNEAALGAIEAKIAEMIGALSGIAAVIASPPSAEDPVARTEVEGLRGSVSKLEAALAHLTDEVRQVCVRVSDTSAVDALLQRIADDAESRRAELHEKLLDVRGVSARNEAVLAHLADEVRQVRARVSDTSAVDALQRQFREVDGSQRALAAVVAQIDDRIDEMVAHGNAARAEQERDRADASAQSRHTSSALRNLGAANERLELRLAKVLEQLTEVREDQLRALAGREEPAPALTLGDLLAAEPASFLDQSYERLLNRPVDAEGRAFFSDALDRGMNRISVLGNLAFSEEGRAAGAQLQGLEEALAAVAAGPTRPATEAATETTSVEAAVSPVEQAQSEFMTIHDLLGYHDEQFVRAAYRTLLRRDADRDGLRHYVALLRGGESRLRVLADLSRSGEGRIIGATVPGMKRALRAYRVRRALSARPLWNRWSGGVDESAHARLRAVENGVARALSALDQINQSGPRTALSPAQAPAARALAPTMAPVVDDQILAPLPDPRVEAPLVQDPDYIKLDAERRIPLQVWAQNAPAILERLWPATAERPSAQADGLLVVVSGGPASARLRQSLDRLRQASSFAVDVVELGAAQRGVEALDFAAVEAKASDGDLLLFLDASDEIDPRLGDTLLKTGGWSRDFILTDQGIVEGEDLRLVSFHGIDPLHLQFADYMQSRFLLSSAAFRAVREKGAASVYEVAQAALAHIGDRRGAQAHLPFPFILNGSLTDETLRARRVALRHDLQADNGADAAESGTVSAIICTKDSGYLLHGLVSQLLAMPHIKDVVIVSNNTSSDYSRTYLDELSEDGRCKILVYDKPFNFSEQNNLGVQCAKGEYLLFLNDDISPIGTGWLDRMMDLVRGERPRIVGPLLLYPDQTIQHGGMYLGFNNCAGHSFRHLTAPHDAPMFELVAPRRVSSLTGACLLMKRATFDNLNGFDALLATMLQDVDLSLRALYSGVELVFDPRSILFHLESISIKKTLTDEAVLRRRDREYALFRARWSEEIWSDYYHNRSLDLQDEALRAIKVAK